MKIRLALATAAMLAGTGIVGASAAHATDDCWLDPDGSGPAPTIDYPCPSPSDQIVPLPVAVVVAGGPGYGMPEYDFTRVRHGGRIWFVNPTNRSLEYRVGTNSTGLVPPGGVAEVPGVPAMAIGHYKVYSGADPYGDLYIDPDYCDSLCQP